MGALSPGVLAGSLLRLRSVKKLVGQMVHGQGGWREPLICDIGSVYGS